MSRSCERFACILALLLCAASLPGCKSDQQKREAHMARAESYMAEGKKKEALLELRNALQLDPNNAATNMRIAQILQGQQEFGDAAFYFSEAYRLDPNLSDAALAQAMLLSFAETDRAEGLVQQVLEREPSSARAHAVRSHLALIRKDMAQALTSALTAVELDPKNRQAAHQLGIVHQARIREARDIEHKEPGDEVFAAAVAAFERAAQLGNPGEKAASMRERARVLATWPGHEAEAEAAFRELVGQTGASGDPKLARQGAEAALVYARKTRNTPLRRWAIDKLLAADPGNIEAWTAAADLDQVERGEGEAVYRRLLDQRPKDAQAHIAYARFLAQQGRVKEALSQLESQAGSSDDPAAMLGFIVDLYYGLGQPERASQVVSRLEKEYPDSVRTQLAQAQRMIAENRFNEAADRMRELSGKVESADALRLLALAEYRRGRMTESAEAMARALELSPDAEPSTLQLAAEIQYANRNWDQLLATIQSLYDTQGRLPGRMRILFAEALFETGRSVMAKSSLENELKIDEPDAEAVLLFARYRAVEEPERARKLMEAASQRSPDDVRLLAGLAQLDLAAGRREQALKRLDAALAGDLPEPRTAALRLLRAQVLLQLGQAEKAEADALRAFQAAPGNQQAMELLVAIYASQGRLDAGISSLEEARSVGALGPGGQELLGRLYAQAGREDEAIALLEELLEQPGERPGTKNDLAFLLAKKGRDLDRALGLAREAQQALERNPGVADTLGYVYYRKELYGPAVEQFRYALQLAGARAAAPSAESATYHYHLALALRGQGRPDEAKQELASALALDPELAEAKAELAELEHAPAAAAPGPGSS